MKLRDNDIPATKQGRFLKYGVSRVDGRADPETAQYFVLRTDDLEHRPADRAALSAYVTAVHPTHPMLAADLAQHLPAVDMRASRDLAAQTCGQLLPQDYRVVSGIGDTLTIQDASGKDVGSFAWDGPQDTAPIVATGWSHAVHTTLAEVDEIKTDLERLDKIDSEHHEAMIAAGLPRECTTIEKVCGWIRAQASAAKETGPTTIINNTSFRTWDPLEILGNVATTDADPAVRIEAVKAIAVGRRSEPTIVRDADQSRAVHEVKAERERALQALGLFGWTWQEGDVLGWAQNKTDPKDMAAQYLLSMPPGFIIHFANKCEDGTEFATRWTWSAPESQSSSSDFAEPLLALEDAWVRYCGERVEQARKEAARTIDEMGAAKEQLRADCIAAELQSDAFHEALVICGMPKDCKDPQSWAAVHNDGHKTMQSALTRFVNVYEVDGAKVKNLAALEQMCDAFAEQCGGPTMARTYHPEFGKMVTVTIPVTIPAKPKPIAATNIAASFPESAQILVCDPCAIVAGNDPRVHVINASEPAPGSAVGDRASTVLAVRGNGDVEVRKHRHGHVGLIKAPFSEFAERQTAKSLAVQALRVIGGSAVESIGLGGPVVASFSDGPTPVKAPGWTGITWTSRKGKAKSMSIPGLMLHRETTPQLVTRLSEGESLSSAAIGVLRKMWAKGRVLKIHMQGGQARYGKVMSYADVEAPGCQKGDIFVQMGPASDQQPAH